MLNRLTGALLAVSLTLGAAPAAARVTPASIEPRRAAAVGSAQFEEWGAQAYILAAVVVGFAFWGLIELLDDNEEEVSPE